MNEQYNIHNPIVNWLSKWFNTLSSGNKDLIGKYTRVIYIAVSKFDHFCFLYST